MTRGKLVFVLDHRVVLCVCACGESEAVSPTEFGVCDTRRTCVLKLFAPLRRNRRHHNRDRAPKPRTNDKREHEVVPDFVARPFGNPKGGMP